jgi:hypothetical protein
MAKTPARRSRSVPVPAQPVKRPRGRPPRPGGPTPHVEIQRAYRARLKAAGKVLKLVDAGAIADFNPDTEVICSKELLATLRDDLHDALIKLELRDQDAARFEARNHWLENELKRVEQYNTNVLKEVILLRKEQVAAPFARTRRPRAK